MARRPSIDWLEFALAELGREGPGALVPDQLTKRAGLTRGAFYHRFASVDAFHAELLASWQARNTAAVIAMSVQASPGAERQAALGAASAAIDHQLDRAVRAWALSDPRARDAVAAVDKERIDFVAANLDGPQPLREQLARAIYLVYVGAQQVYPELAGPQLQALIEPIDAWLLRAAGVSESQTPGSARLEKGKRTKSALTARKAERANNNRGGS